MRLFVSTNLAELALFLGVVSFADKDLYLKCVALLESPTRHLVNNLTNSLSANFIALI